jgi:hypothetical protein
MLLNVTSCGDQASIIATQFRQDLGCVILVLIRCWPGSVQWRITCNCHLKPAFIMCFMWLFSRGLGVLLLLMLRCRCLLWCMVVWCLFLSRLVVSARLYRGVWELLVQWDGADATWTPLEDFKTAYPSFQLEDELFQGRGKCCGLFLP